MANQYDGRMATLGVFKPTDISSQAASIVSTTYYGGAGTQYGKLTTAFKTASGLTNWHDMNEYDGNAVDAEGSSDWTDNNTVTSAIGPGTDKIVDESGNANHGTITGYTNTGDIVSTDVPSALAGSLDYSMEFDGSNDHLDTADFTPLTQPNFITLTHKGNVANGTKWIFSTSTSNTNRNFFLQDGRYYAGSFVSSGSVGTSQVNISILADGTNTEVFKNGLSVVTGNAGTNGIQKIRLFADRDGGVSLSALFQEFILWNEDDTNRAGIETNINFFYDIY